MIPGRTLVQAAAIRAAVAAEAKAAVTAVVTATATANLPPPLQEWLRLRVRLVARLAKLRTKGSDIAATDKMIDAVVLEAHAHHRPSVAV